LVPARRTVSVGDAVLQLQTNGLVNDVVILRHDVDRRPIFAVRMAEYEHRLDVRSSYYFRCDSKGHFPCDAVRKIADLGHEVGFHYECLSRCSGDRAAALAQFRMQLEAFRQIAPCNTVAMHGAPFSLYSNQDLLIHESLRDYGLLADAVLSLDHLTLAYFTDTGGRWQASPTHNMRDHVGVARGSYPSPAHQNFPSWLANFQLPVYISTHPERWADGLISFGEALGRDFSANQAKRIVRILHGWSRCWGSCQTGKD
jgi:hypothetical protein